MTRAAANDGHVTMAAAKRRVRVPKMAELVANAIKEQIIRGELPAGSTLPPESVLMAEFGVSRPTLREAFRVLEAESLLTVQRGVNGGARVQPPSLVVAARYAGLLLQYKGTPLADVYDVRAVLEVPCAGGLARSHTDDDIARLRRRLEETREAGHQPDRQVAAHVAFHSELVELSGNETLILLHQIVNEIIDKDYSTRARTQGGRPEWQHVSLNVHNLLVDMIDAGDADGAEGLWRRHLADGALFALGNAGRSKALDIL
jgi:GntR family transcriptional repressor for pyruvate dehydrogenase complex